MAMLTRLTSNGTTTVAPGSPKGLQRFQNYLSAFLWPGTSHRQQRKSSTQLDAIDSFTDELVNRKTQKWEELRDNLIKKSVVTEEHQSNSGNFSQNVGLMSKGMMNDLKQLRSPQLGLDIRSLSQPQLDNLLLATLEIKNKVDFLYLIKQCVRWQLLPCNEVFISCLRYLSTLGRLQQLDSLAETCRQLNHPFTITYSDLAPFKALALWNNGNADVALMTLHRGYSAGYQYIEGKRMMRSTFRTIAEETLAQKSEAVLISLTEVARAIHQEHNDIFMVACVWKQCFISSWFSDQKSASELYEHFKDLQRLVARRADGLCYSFLGHHNVDAVHRLIEVFLEHNERAACADSLSSLFDYHYNRKDLRACAEIVKSCSELEMPLKTEQNEQFLSLFLDNPDPFETTKNKGNKGNAIADKKYMPESFKYKF
ncbi:hypothetical protein KR093_011044 [Drosophila rubida]|uniref:Uncharacterized protein n=1 Tax=Drosophila rubida TaxID=30044 RepID=A0AAD4K285_9MUSC|nr:hypothetical protein KR093_011044 [Drosophila rubida]